MLLPLLAASDTAKAAPSAAGTCAAGFFASTGARADGCDVEAERGRRQQAHIGEHREAAADARIVVEHRHLMLGQQIAQAIALARLGRLADAEERSACIEP